MKLLRSPCGGASAKEDCSVNPFTEPVCVDESTEIVTECVSVSMRTSLQIYRPNRCGKL